MLRGLVEELRDLGPRRALFRVGWELRTRTGLAGRSAQAARLLPVRARRGWEARLPFAAPADVSAFMAPLLSAAELTPLREEAHAAVEGRIRAFGRWDADYGDPIDWRRDPVSGERWREGLFWSKALAGAASIGDIKLAWEVGRFPQAYAMARNATYHPEDRGTMARGLADQVVAFARENPFQRGIHWHSAQELAFRHFAWLFAQATLWGQEGSELDPAFSAALEEQLLLGAAHVDAVIDYARFAVYNNHLLSEALLLYATGLLFPEHPLARRWTRRGRALLTEGAERQFAADGGYIQNSHNYHRVALQDLLLATAFARKAGEAPPQAWLTAMDRSLDFLYAHQNPEDGHLPNFGANDGALPLVLSTCAFGDFRPVLQAVSVGLRGERLYPPGPWDEESAWLWGPRALDVPVRVSTRRSRSFGISGYHVLRGTREDSFAAFRCGSVRDRFSQIDMLHLDLWWRGHNVLVDGGSYLYNGPKEWHDHFYETASHNALTVEGEDQMVHHRRFKNLHWTPAQLLRFEPDTGAGLLEGQHTGYQRLQSGALHRRTVLAASADIWIVLDQVLGTGRHDLRLQWLGGAFPWTHDERAGLLELETPSGSFSVTMLDAEANPLPTTVVAGGLQPPRGWLSRYYGEKEPVPSLAWCAPGELPWRGISVLGAGRPSVSFNSGRWEIQGTGGTRVRFRLASDTLGDLHVESSSQ